MIEFKFAPRLLKNYALKILHMSPTSYSTIEKMIEAECGLKIPGVEYTLTNSKRTETVTSEELAWFNENLN